jgi:L-threonylcarbamoyladenylate synthase
VKNNFEKDIQECLTVLNNGGIILYPTDTVWGIGCDATNVKAVQKIFELKQRADNKALIVLVTEEQDILQYVAAPDMEIFDYLASNEKPTTVIYEGAIGLADPLIGQDGSVGIRICQDPFCRQLIKRFQKPIVSTSANISGQPTPMRFTEIDPTVMNTVDYTVQWRQDDEKEGQPSRIIRWENGKVEIIRP